MQETRRDLPGSSSSASENAPIGDYAIIGNCRAAALVSRSGSIDWLCVPRFDSPSIFAALLDPVKGGRFQICPTSDYESSRCYIDHTNVLQTTFTTSSGVVRLTDLMPVTSEEEKRQVLWPEHEVLRLIECVSGEVEIEVLCDPRPDYGRMIPHLTREGALGLFYDEGPNMLALQSELPVETREGEPGASGKETLRAGDRRFVALTFAHGFPAVLPVFGDVAQHKIDVSIAWWRAWTEHCRYQGDFREAVIRSALALKLMTYAPSGAVIAAPTTSLPEKIGGVRNWDYRYCWLRDASLTTRALFELGFDTEAQAFLAWLLHATRLTWPELQVIYDVFGETHLKEREMDWLSGYANSRPVRVGNAAAEQFQLDVYGNVLDAAFRFVTRGGRVDRATARLLRGLGTTVCKRWREPDEGIWEVRSGRTQHTYSKVMCWVTLDRLLQMHARGHLVVPAQEFARERDAIRTVIETHGYNAQIGSYVSMLDGDQVDASLLQLAFTGYADPKDERMKSTLRAIYDRLGVGALLFRYRAHDDGLPAGEAAFGICSFWGVDCRARSGDVARATADFEKLLTYQNDVGLYAEEIDVETGAALGNFPQAFTHVGLINAAVSLAKAKGQHPHKSEQQSPETKGEHL
jgi:GH15 family glucan-1,4-alpha-glucosidase